MNFKYDLAQILKEELMQSGINIPADWDDYHICMNYLQISHRWFNSSVPYRVIYSKELMEKLPLLTKTERDALRDIEERLGCCKSLTSYMSRDISKTEIKKSDFLLKNWDIYHLHLEQLLPPKIRYTLPNLLFFQPKGSVVHFIDIKPHPKGATWFDRDLLEIIYKNWPWLLKYLKGLKPTQSISDNQIHDALKHCVTFLEFHGGVLMPTNIGVASSGDSSMAVRETDRIFNSLKKSEEYLKNNEEEIKNHISNELGINIGFPLDYELIIENGFFVAYEKTTKLKQKLFRTV